MSDQALATILQWLPNVVTLIKTSTVGEFLEMSSHEIVNTLVMCGLQTRKESLLPHWMTKINEKDYNNNTQIKS